MPKKLRKRHRRAKTPRYNLMPAIAAVIFIAVTLFARTDRGQSLEIALSGLVPESLSENITPIFSPAEKEASPPPAEQPDDPYAEAEQIFLSESAPPPLTPIKKDKIAALTVKGEDGGYTGAGTVFIRNNSKFDVNIKDTMALASPVKLSGKGVQVLIMHTHGTEAYTPDAKNPYKPSDTDRTTDNLHNVVRLGDEIEKILTAKGIKVVHSRVLNDSPAYSGSYNRALSDITANIKKNPSIKVVIDVHRDAMVTSNGTKYKTIADINGTNAAQLMFVTGTNGGGLTHDKWRQNLSFQMRLQDKMNTKYPGIMRPINIRDGRFNQHVTTGSMLLEVGTSGNSLEEAIYSVKLFANVLADTLNAK